MKTWLFFLIATPIISVILIGYQYWKFGEPLANISIWLYLYFGTWISIKGSVKKFNKYFGENGLYMPEESIDYHWNFKLGGLYIKALPKGKI